MVSHYEYYVYVVSNPAFLAKGICKVGSMKRNTNGNTVQDKITTLYQDYYDKVIIIGCFQVEIEEDMSFVEEQLIEEYDEDVVGKTESQIIKHDPNVVAKRLKNLCKEMGCFVEEEKKVLPYIDPALIITPKVKSSLSYSKIPSPPSSASLSTVPLSSKYKRPATVFIKEYLPANLDIFRLKVCSRREGCFISRDDVYNIFKKWCKDKDNRQECVSTEDFCSHVRAVRSSNILEYTDKRIRVSGHIRDAWKYNEPLLSPTKVKPKRVYLADSSDDEFSDSSSSEDLREVCRRNVRNDSSSESENEEVTYIKFPIYRKKKTTKKIVNISASKKKR